MSSVYESKESCVEMIKSILAYGGFGKTPEQILKEQEEAHHNYLEKYVNGLGRETVLCLIKETSDSISHIKHGVYTDNEGLTYNSIVYKNDSHQ